MILSILPVANMANQLRFWTLLLLILLGFPSASYGADDKVISIAFGMDRAPYLFPKGSEQGLEIDIVSSALKLEGYRVKVKQLPQLALKTALLDDLNLAAAAGGQTDTSPGVYYSDVYINYENYVITRREDGLVINTLEDLIGRKIAIWSDGYNQLGKSFYTLFNPSARAIHTPDFYEVNDQANQLNLFFNRDVDVVIVDKTVFYWYKKLIAPNLFDDQDFVFHEVLPQVTGYNVRFRDRILRDHFNSGLHKLMESGHYQELIDYYLSSKGVTIQRQLSRDGEIDGDLTLTKDEKRWLRLNPIVTFTGDPNWLPFEGFDSKGNYSGIVADHLSLLEQKLGIYFSKIKPASWDDALQIAVDGKVDVISSGGANSVLYQQFEPVQSFISNPVVIVMTEEDDFVGSIDDIKQKRIAMIRNASFNQEIRNRYPSHNIVAVENLREGLEGVSSGKFDAMLATMALANYNIGDMGLYNLRIVGKTEFDIEVTLFVSKTKPVLHGILNKAMQSVTPEEHQHIISRWIRQSYVERSNYRLVALVVAVFLLIFAVFLYWNRRLSEEVELRKSTEAALQIAKEKAEQATLAKSAFLSNMSHEIRTPMNAIMGFTELLGEGIKDKQQLGFIRTIQSAGNALLTLINDILDLSKIEAGKLDIHQVATDPHELFNDVAKLFMVELSKKQLQLDFDIDKQIPHSLLLDTARLRQILFNLIGNAVKFTESGSVQLMARQTIDKHHPNRIDLLISVEDTGIGIRAADLPYVFGTFEQAKNQDNQKYGGTGLGLAISRRLARLMNGDITVVSTVGKGTRFDLMLRDVEVSAHIVKANAIENEAAKEYVIFEPCTVLIVDDVEINRLLVQECLADTRINFLTAASGEEGLTQLQQYPVDLILMDIRMPGMDGYEAAEKAKLLVNAPIIALTATVMDPLDQDFIDSAFDSYLKKPVYKSELFRALKQYLPYEQSHQWTAAPSESTVVELNSKALNDASTILAILNDELLPQWQAIRASNKVSDIKRFAETIQMLGSEFGINACIDYARVLNETVDAYDIVGIKNSVKSFPVLSGMIKKRLEKASIQG